MVSTSGNQKGGGIGSRQHIETSIRRGTGNRGANPAGVSQLGNKVGDHITSTVNTNYRGDRLHGVPTPSMSVPFGNEVALNSKSAPGQGRDIHACGSQGQHGAPAQGNPPPSRRTFD